MTPKLKQLTNITNNITTRINDLEYRNYIITYQEPILHTGLVQKELHENKIKIHELIELLKKICGPNQGIRS